MPDDHDPEVTVNVPVEPAARGVPVNTAGGFMPPLTGSDQAPKAGAASPFLGSSYFDLLRSVVTAQDLTAEQKKTLLDGLRKASPTSDRLTYRLAIGLLGVIALFTIGATWHLLSQKTAAQIPDGLIAIASAAVGGLAGLLSPGRGNGSESSK